MNGSHWCLRRAHRRTIPRLQDGLGDPGGSPGRDTREDTFVAEGPHSRKRASAGMPPNIDTASRSSCLVPPAESPWIGPFPLEGANQAHAYLERCLQSGQGGPSRDPPVGQLIGDGPPAQGPRPRVRGPNPALGRPVDTASAHRHGVGRLKDPLRSAVQLTLTGDSWRPRPLP
jgi:hypothetical protein